jgi:hypothetical protein
MAWPVTPFKSIGQCEICKETKICSDLPSNQLPLPEEASYGKKEVKEDISKLIKTAKEEYEWGGDERSDGGLGYGYVDFDEIEKKLLTFIDNLEV